jgi:hypothetical protein
MLSLQKTIMGTLAAAYGGIYEKEYFVKKKSENIVPE